jgi:lysylphosphatidylglycerol synthetase-like protein (DUF2156 family)
MTEFSEAGPAPTRRFWTMTESRAVLIAAGVLATGVGVLVFAGDVSPAQYPAVLGWLVGALVVHDVLIAGLVFAVVVAGRRSPRRVAPGTVVVLQSGLAVAAIVALVVAPEIVKKSMGTANPTVLPLDYGLHLAVFLVALAIVTIGAAVLHATLVRTPAPPQTDK